MNKISRYQVATATAIVFHLIGLIGILYVDKALFTSATVFNLLLMFVLILYTHDKLNLSFFVFFAVCFTVGFLVEVVGTKTGWLFGKYQYGETLGLKLMGVPLIIGINWFLIMYCCGITIYTVLRHLLRKLSLKTGEEPQSIKIISVIVDGATLAVFFDWIMEPVAVKLGYWIWEGDIPFFNYLCWFLLSSFFMFLFNHLDSSKRNKFAVNLLLIQIMFFLLLRTFL